MSEQTEGARSGCFCMGFGPAVADMFKKMGPSESVKGHFRSARIEVLKGLRAMIDERIDCLSRTEHKGTHVNVE